MKLLLLLLSPLCLAAATVILAWDQNVELDLSGYKVYWGTTPNNYTHVIDAGCVTTQEVSGLTYTNYLVVTAYNTSGLESDPSAELQVNVTVIPSIPTQVMPIGGFSVVKVPLNTLASNAVFSATPRDTNFARVEAGLEYVALSNLWQGIVKLWTGQSNGTCAIDLSVADTNGIVSSNSFILVTVYPKSTNFLYGNGVKLRELPVLSTDPVTVYRIRDGWLQQRQGLTSSQWQWQYAYAVTNVVEPVTLRLVYTNALRRIVTIAQSPKAAEVFPVKAMSVKPVVRTITKPPLP